MNLVLMVGSYTNFKSVNLLLHFFVACFLLWVLNILNEGEKELVELGLAKDTMETSYKNELNRVACLVEQKGNADTTKPFITAGDVVCLETFLTT